MDASAAQGGITPLRLPCPECNTDNPKSARYCKHCGAAVSPPSVCPKCEAAVPNDARFCPSCGAKLVGPRPVAAAEDPHAAHDEIASQSARAEVHRQAMELPASSPQRPGSSLGGNFLVFVAMLVALLVVIYIMNKDAPKEHNPFQGGPPPAASVTPSPSNPAPPPTASSPAAGGEPIAGTITVPSELAKTAAGSLFVVVRIAGSPNRGPPLAVKLIQSPSFPQTFSIGPGDVVLPNMPFTGPFDVYVRLDQDGNAMTKEPGDLRSSTPATGVTPGTSGLSVVLDKQL